MDIITSAIAGFLGAFIYMQIRYLAQRNKMKKQIIELIDKLEEEDGRK